MKFRFGEVLAFEFAGYLNVACRRAQYDGLHSGACLAFDRRFGALRRNMWRLRMDAGLLVVRLVVGSLMAAHGAQKLFGWFRGYGLAATGEFFEQLGFRPGKWFAEAAGLAECCGGVLLALGLFEAGAAALILSVMIVAAVTVHRGNGLLATSNGIEMPLLYASAGIALALTGPGAYSFDAVFGLVGPWTPAVSAGVLIVGVLAGCASLLLRRPANSTLTPHGY
jgi:putative oxidoreductase